MQPPRHLQETPEHSGSKRCGHLALFVIVMCVPCGAPPPILVLERELLQEVVLLANLPVVYDTEIDVNIPCMLTWICGLDTSFP